MRKLVCVGLLLATAAALAPIATADVKITDQSYVRHDGGTDATIASCNSDVPSNVPGPPAVPAGGGERQQNEPTAAVDPMSPNRMTAGANDYCGVPTIGDAYGGFYWSTDSGTTWANSLLPGYPADNSAEGSNCDITPQHCLVGATGDPVQAFDRFGHVFFGVIGFNRVRPANGSLFAARYDWALPVLAPDYRWTALVKRGTPSPLFRGRFNDKIAIEADRGVASPFAGNAARPWGNVYICWARFTASGPNNGVWFTRSTDGGRTYENAQKISEGVHGSQFCDIAVTSNGTVYVVWRQFEFHAQQPDAVVIAKSTDGGARFTKPREIARFIHFDNTDLGASPERAEAEHEACLQGDLAEPEACGEQEGGAQTEEPSARDCGDGPFVCRSGYVFFRQDSQTRIAADPTDTSRPQAAYVVYNASVPGSQTATGTSYGTIEPGVGSQGQIYFIRTLDGSTWTGGTGVSGQGSRITPGQAKGHQFFPDIDANAGRLHVVWQDSRNDTASGPPTTPSGGDFRTVPISNKWVSSNPPGSVSTGPGVGIQSFYASSTNAGASWTALLASSAPQMPQYEQFGNRDLPFFGDYNYISAVGSTVLMNWTDQRDPAETKPGTDPRYSNGDGTDGFDVVQCRAARPDGTFGPDTCPNAGGLDENIFGMVFMG
ncbi:MAG TPA: sialidase family protein [Gaiellaceae bacterium]|jgi:hypothetical protein|nr:sialidase family protein [Gaiellaceae bacterium]